MCGDGANDCGVRDFKIVFSRVMCVFYVMCVLMSVCFVLRHWRELMLGFPCQSWRLQSLLPLHPQLPASPACPIWSGVLTAPQLCFKPQQEKSSFSDWIHFTTITFRTQNISSPTKELYYNYKHYIFWHQKPKNMWHPALTIPLAKPKR